MKRRLLSLFVAFAMTISMVVVGAVAVEPTYGDTAGHWAENAIDRWSGHGIIQGSNGEFDPNGPLTCAQLATILAKLLKLPVAKDAGFNDNAAGAWYYDAINRCAAAGILNGNGDGTVTPEAPITRERAMVMLARALGIEPIRKPDLTKYTDAAQVSAYAQGYVAALIEAGIVGGVTADELAPQDNINRASTVTILDRAISTYADQAGATIKADGKGLVLVVAENVKITGAPEGTKIVVADGATGLSVNGKSVSDDQTYIVPKTTPGSGSSSGGYSHTHTWKDNYCDGCDQFTGTVVAAIGKKGYETVAAAITAANGSGTVTLLKATTESIQEILDGQHGSIDGLTIELPSGNYGELKLARVVAETKDNLTYTCNHTDGTHYTYTDVDEYKSHLAENVFHYTNTYTRTMHDVKLVANGDVTVNGLLSESGHLHQKANPFRDGHTGYYFNQKLTNFTFEGIKFVGNVNINTSSADTEISNFTFKNCSFTTNGTESGNGPAIRYYNENNDGKVSDLKVINCTFTDCYQGVYTGHIKNVTVTDSSFTNTGHNAIAIQNNSDKGTCNHGNVVITRNTFANIGDRIIRFNTVGADTQITITNNTVIGELIKKEVIKAESLADGVTCNIHSNSWGDGATFGTGFTEETGEPCAEINGVKYISLPKALAAAKSGDTVKLVGDTTLRSSVEINKSITLDLNGKTIHYTGADQKDTNPTMSHRALNVTGGTVTIKNGSITTTVAGTDYSTEFDAVVVKSGAEVTLKDMNITINDAKGSCLYVFESGKATVKSGSYTNTNTSGEKLLLNQANVDTQLIFVEGGTFSGRSPAVGDEYKGGTFLAPGYTVDNNNGVYTVRPMKWNEYPADGTLMPADVEIKDTYEGDGENGKTFTITLKDKEAFLYFTQIFDREKAFEARKAGLENGSITRFEHEYNMASLNMWYGPYCSRITVKLACNVDLGGMEIKPFGMSGYVFNFDGNGHTIKNAMINKNSGDVGFFQSRAKVSNVVFDGIHVTATGCDSAGVVAGSPNSNITNVTVKNCSVTGAKYTGAIAGYDYGDITNCTVENSVVSGQYKVGGIIGYVCSDNAEQHRKITGNNLTGVEVKGEDIWPGKESNGFVIGKIVGNWNAANGTCNDNSFVTGKTVATNDIGEIESGCTVNGVTYVTVTPSTIPSPFQANTTYLFTAGNYGIRHFVITDRENVTLIGQPGAEFDSLQISSIDYVNSEHNQVVDLGNSTLTVKGFNVSKTLMIVVSDKNVVVTDNIAAQITVKTNVSCTGIAVNANKLTGGESAAQKYGVYIVPNITNYDLTITGNTFENIAKHAIGVQGCGDGSAVTAANSITVEDNQFNSYGTDKGSRAAFKIWEDTKLAPDSTSELNNAAKALAASVQAKNIFAATLDGSCILADFYGKTVPFSPTSPM